MKKILQLVNHKLFMKMHQKNLDTTIHDLPEDMHTVLHRDPDVLKRWNDLTPLARNEWICWTTIVKKMETRTKHLNRMVEDLLKGKKRPCCWPGCPHHRPDTAKWFK